MAGMRASIELAAKKKGFLVFSEFKKNLSNVSDESTRTRKELVRLNQQTEAVRERFGSAVASARNFAVAIGAGMGLAELTRSAVMGADAFKQLTTRISRMGMSVDSIYALSQANGVATLETVRLTESLNRAASELGRTQTETLTMTGLLQQLGVIGGSSAEDMKNSMRQFGQAMSGGVVRAEEFNSILEGTPEIAARIGEGMGLSMGQLRAAMLDGKLTADAVFQSLIGQAGQIASEYAKVPLSIDSAMIMLGNAWQRLSAEVDKHIGVTGLVSGNIAALAGVFDSLRNGLDAAVAQWSGFLVQLQTGGGVFELVRNAVSAVGDQLAAVLDQFAPLMPYLGDFALGIGAIIAAAGGLSVVATAFGLVTTAIKMMATVLLANPVVATIALIAGAANLIYQNWEPIKSWWNDFWSVFSEPAKAAWSKLKATVADSEITKSIQSAWESVPDYIKAPLNKVVDKVSDTWGHIQQTVEDKGYIQGGISLMAEFSASVIKEIQSIPGEAQKAWSDLQRLVGDSQFITGALQAWEILRPTVIGILADIKDGAIVAFEAISSAFSYVSADFAVISSEISQTLAVWLNWWSGESSTTMMVVRDIFKIGWDWIKGIVSGAWDIISTSAKAGWDLISGLLTVGLRLLRGDWSGAWDAMKGTVVDFGLGIFKILRTINEKIAGFVKRVVGAVSGAAQSVKNLFGFADEAAEAGQKMADGFTGPLPQMKTELDNVGSSADDASGSLLGNAEALLKSMRKAIDHAEANRKLKNSSEEAAKAITEAAAPTKVLTESTNDLKDKTNELVKPLTNAGTAADKATGSKQKLTEAQKTAAKAADELGKANQRIADQFVAAEQKQAVLNETLLNGAAAGRQLELRYDSLHNGVMLMTKAQAEELQQKEALNKATENEIAVKQQLSDMTGQLSDLTADLTTLQQGGVAALEASKVAQQAVNELKAKGIDLESDLAQRYISAAQAIADKTKVLEIEKQLQADNKALDWLEKEIVATRQNTAALYQYNLSKEIHNKLSDLGITLESDYGQQIAASTRAMAGKNQALKITQSLVEDSTAMEWLDKQIAATKLGTGALDEFNLEKEIHNKLSDLGITLESDYGQQIAASTRAMAGKNQALKITQSLVEDSTAMEWLDKQIAATKLGTGALDEFNLEKEIHNKLSDLGITLESDYGQQIAASTRLLAEKNKELEVTARLNELASDQEWIQKEIAATIQGTDALEQFNLEKEIHNELTRLGVDAESAMGQQITETLTKNNELKASLSDIQNLREPINTFFMDAFDSGKTAFSNLGDYLKSWLKQMIAEFATNKIMAFIGVEGSGASGGGFNLGSLWSGANNMVSSGLSSIGGFLSNSFGGIGSSISGMLGGVGSTLGGIGSSILGSMGGIGSTISSALGGVGSALGGITAALGPIGIAAGILSLGFGSKQTTGAGVQVGYSTEDGFEGQNYEDWKKKKWFKYRNGTDYSEMDSGAEESIHQYFYQMDSTIAEQAEAMGVKGAENILNGFKTATVKLGGDDIDGQLQTWLGDTTNEAYEHAFKKLPLALKQAVDPAYEQITMGGQKMSGFLGHAMGILGNALSQTALTAEELAARFQYIAAVTQTVQPSLEALGFELTETETVIRRGWLKTMVSTREVAGSAAKNATLLTDELGGVDSAMQILSFYASNFAPQGILAAKALDQTREQLNEWNASIGLTGDAIIDTKAEFYQYVQALDLTTEAGREAMASAMAQMQSLLTVAAANEEAAIKFDAVSNAARNLNLNFDATSPLASGAASALIELMGGLESFTAATQNYYDQFYSQTEQQQLALAQSADAVSVFNEAMGLSGAAAIDTAAEFRAYVESLDLTTAEGREAYAAAMDVASAMAAVAESGMTLDQLIDSLPENLISAFELMSGGSQITADVIGDAANDISSASDVAGSSLNHLGDAINSVANVAASAAQSALSAANDASYAAQSASAAASNTTTGVVPAYASGGYYPGGLALVGEQGPELINFKQPGYIHTAAETQKLMDSQEINVPANVIDARPVFSERSSNEKDQSISELKEEIRQLKQVVVQGNADRNQNHRQQSNQSGEQVQIMREGNQHAHSANRQQARTQRVNRRLA